MLITPTKTHGMTEQVLHEKTASILLIEERERKDIVVCAPHHTVGGVKNMPCPEHSDGDENTGFIARQIAEDLKAPSIIACNYRMDPNKNLRTDYSLQLEQWNPKYLIEIHGHGARKVDDYTIEISSGSIKRNAASLLFSATLTGKFQNHDVLKKYKVYGDYDKIHFKAAKTATIIDERWTPFHIELPPSIRLDKDNKLPRFIEAFNLLLAETINEVCK